MDYTVGTARLHGQWAENVSLSVSDDGLISNIDTAAAVPDNENIAVPGVVNGHSHAFQRAMAGYAEVAGQGDQNFWSWRAAMYKVAGLLAPEDQYIIAAQAYMEMLKAGYTRVTEFHYLHHQPDGTRYDNPTETSEAIIAAAKYVGINLTLLPTLYIEGGFQEQLSDPVQHRFTHDLDEYLALITNLLEKESKNMNLGVSIHSLRAVPIDIVTRLVESVNEIRHGLPIHIHIAEQEREVSKCLAVHKLRPIELLYENCDIDARWSLVHATHANERELQMMAQSDCTVVLCPTTEANLGDGIFPLGDFVQAGGSFSVGSDSNISINVIEELRWLEYLQRLVLRKRGLMSRDDTRNVGTALWESAVIGGATATATNCLGLQQNQLADFLLLDGNHPDLAGSPREKILDTLVFAGSPELIKDVVCAGKKVVENGRHIKEQEISDRYRMLMKNEILPNLETV